MKTILTNTLILSFFLLTINFSIAQEKTVQTGFVTVEQVSADPNNAWFTANYDAYKPDKYELKVIKNMPEDYEIVVIGGLWCPISRKHIPELYKVTDLAAIPRDRVKLHLVDQKFFSEEGLADQYNVEGVPTFIILQNGKEVERVMVYEEETIEESLANVVADVM